MALRFLFGKTCGREEMKKYMQFRTQPRKLPTVLSIEDVSELLAAAPGPGLKYRAALSVSYGAGLRASEVCNLKVSDIDSDRMLIHVDVPLTHASMCCRSLDRQRTTLLQGAIVVRPIPGLASRWNPSVHHSQISCWIHNMNPLNRFMLQSPLASISLQTTANAPYPIWGVMPCYAARLT